MLKSIDIEIVDIELDVLPPSARAVYLILKENNPMYIGEITEHSAYSRRTVQQALHLLEKSDLVTHYPDMRDLRRHQYTIT
ncbi:MAG: MarR family transcriptional regulator [Candidatus Hodarchaeales archaeon]|jgi:DNA-binding MarR family transcriptional regulator